MVLDTVRAHLPARCHVRPELGATCALAQRLKHKQPTHILPAGLAGGRRARQLVWLDDDHVLLVAQCLSPQPDGAAAQPSSSTDELLVVDLADGSFQSGKLCARKLLFLPLACHQRAAVLSSLQAGSYALSNRRQCGHPLVCAAEVQLPPGQQVLRALPAEGPAPALLQLQDGALVELRDGALARLASSSFPAPCPLMARIPAGAAGVHSVTCGKHCHLVQPTAEYQSRAGAMLCNRIAQYRHSSLER